MHVLFCVVVSSAEAAGVWRRGVTRCTLLLPNTQTEATWCCDFRLKNTQCLVGQQINDEHEGYICWRRNWLLQRALADMNYICKWRTDLKYYTIEEVLCTSCITSCVAVLLVGIKCSTSSRWVRINVIIEGLFGIYACNALPCNRIWHATVRLNGGVKIFSSIKKKHWSSVQQKCPSHEKSCAYDAAKRKGDTEAVNERAILIIIFHVLRRHQRTEHVHTIYKSTRAVLGVRVQCPRCVVFISNARRFLRVKLSAMALLGIFPAQYHCTNATDESDVYQTCVYYIFSIAWIFEQCENFKIFYIEFLVVLKQHTENFRTQ